MNNKELRARAESIIREITALAEEYHESSNDFAQTRMDDAHGILDELDTNRHGMTVYGRLNRMKKTAPKEWLALAAALLQAAGESEDVK